MKNNNANALMYHHFHDGVKHPQVQGSISGDEFERGLIYLTGKGYKIINPNEWMEKSAKRLIKSNEICITFDDGLKCQYDIALKILDRYGYKAFWFVYSSGVKDRLDDLEIFRHFRTCCFDSIDDFYTRFDELLLNSEFAEMVLCMLRGFKPSQYLKEFEFYTESDRKFRYIRDDILGPEKYKAAMRKMMALSSFSIEDVTQNLWMNNEDILTLHSQGHVLGLHSYSHPTRISELTMLQQYDEYCRNNAHLLEVIGVGAKSMSHPCNSYNDDTILALKRLGIKFGFCSNSSLLNYTELEYPRIDHSNIYKEL